MRIGIRIAGHFRDGIKSPLGRRVIAEDPVPFSYLFEGANRVGLGPGAMPHLLALNKKRVPVIVVRVCGEDPVVSSRCLRRHLEKFGGTIHAMTGKAKQNVRVRESGKEASGAGFQSGGKSKDNEMS